MSHIITQIETPDIETPDVETASADYASRFSGEVGNFFLENQSQAVLSLINSRKLDAKDKSTDTFNSDRLRVLEVGGGHAQLTKQLLQQNFEVWVQGSSPTTLNRVEALQKEFPESIHCFVSPLSKLPFLDNHFDVVIAVRLLSHLEDWKIVLYEMVRVSKRQVIFDYPPKNSFNILYPLFFFIKKRIEGNTRPFNRFRLREIEEALSDSGYFIIETKPQFFIPMVIHRMLRTATISRSIERFCYSIGLTQVLGSPVIALAENVLR